MSISDIESYHSYQDSYFVLHLSANGDSVEIVNHGMDKKATIPEQLDAPACKTREQVLAFLKKIKTKELVFYHDHNLSYPGHARRSFLCNPFRHPCSLEKQIRFVETLISEKSKRP